MPIINSINNNNDKGLKSFSKDLKDELWLRIIATKEIPQKR